MNRRIPRSKVSQDRWLVSYADFITLLFAFFVVLYAFAKADQKKQMQVSAAIDSAFRSLSIDPSLSGNDGTQPGQCFENGRLAAAGLAHEDGVSAFRNV